MFFIRSQHTSKWFTQLSIRKTFERLFQDNFQSIPAMVTANSGSSNSSNDVTGHISLSVTPTLLDSILSSSQPDTHKATLIKELNGLETNIKILKERSESDRKLAQKDAALAQKDAQSAADALQHANAKMKEETLLRMHFQRILTVRGLIESYEKSFDRKLLLKNISRSDKWTQFLTSDSVQFKPFREAGFTIEEVASEIHFLFNSSSATIHSVREMDTFALHIKNHYSVRQMQILEIIVTISGFKNITFEK